MGLFSKKEIVPEWASFFTGNQYTAFMAALDSCLQKMLNVAYEIEDGIVVLEENEYMQGNLGLYNLAQICRQNELADYPQIIAGYLNMAIEVNKFENEFKKIEKDFDQIRQYIAVHLYDSEYIDYVGKENFISRRFTGELFAALVFDLPNTLKIIKPELIELWNKTADELFEIGLGNVRRNYETSVEATEFGPEKDILYVCKAEHFFATNVLFELEKHNGLIGKGGSLVAAPNRNIALIYPINDLRVSVMVNNLCFAVPRLFNNPGSLTKEIYWYKDGKFISLPYNLDKKKINLPEEFIGLLNSLT